MWRSIKTPDEHKEITDICLERKNHVYVRNTLDGTVCLDNYIYDHNLHKLTETAQLVKQAKDIFDEPSINQLVDKAITSINLHPLVVTPMFDDSDKLKYDYICAVPPCPDKTYDLPTALAKQLSSKLNIKDLSSSIKFQNKKGSIKNEKKDDKLNILMKAGLVYHGSSSLKDKNILIIDDNYQSGSTLMYTAMVLKNSGAKNIFGLCMTKTACDSDNTC